MFVLRLDKSLRVACGMGLLGLLVVQEKLWPWLLTAPDPPKPPVAAPPAGQTPGSGNRPSPTPPYVVPDTPPARWTAGCFDPTLHRAAGDRDGVVSCGQPSPTSHAGPLLAVDADALAWRCFQCPGGTLGIVADRAPALGMRAPLRTCITPTGPPPAF
jgi:hypothetical protein